MTARKTAACSSELPSVQSPLLRSLSWGRTIKSGTMARSWTSNMPTMTRLESVPSMLRLASVLMMTMVLESEIMAPNQIEAGQSQSSN